MNPNTVTYTRLSLEGDNVETQLRDCHKLAEQRGWAITEDFCDNGVSAYSRTAHRPAYAAMLKGIQSGEIGRVIVYNLDRLTRQPIELEGLIGHIEQRRLTVSAVNGFSIETDAEIMGARMMVVIANQSSKDTARRVARKCLVNAEAGGAHGRRCYGYQAGGLLVDEAEAAFYGTAVDEVLNGTPLRGTVRKLNAAGAVTTVGSAWTPQALRVTLLNPRHTGVRVHKGTTYPAQWDAIISTERHAQVVAVLNGHVNKAIGTAPKHLLSGILRCGRCGHAVRVVKHSGRAYYTCPPKIEGGCAGVSVSGAGADAYVTECVLGGNPRSRRIDAAASDAGRPVLYVDGKLDQLRQRRFEMASAFADGLVALDLFTLTVNSLDKQITAAEQRQAEVANARVAAVQADHISYRWDTLTLDEKRAAIRQAVVEIKLVPAFSSAPTFDPRRVVVTWPEVDAVPAVFGWWAAGAEQTA